MENLTLAYARESASNGPANDRYLPSLMAGLILHQGVIIFGEQGVGKTRLISGLAKATKDLTIFEVDPTETISDIKKQLKTVVRGSAVLVFEEGLPEQLHSVGLEFLKQGMTAGDFRVIFVTNTKVNPEDYRRFKVLEIKP